MRVSLVLIAVVLVNFLGSLAGVWSPAAILDQVPSGGGWSRCLLLADCATGTFGGLGIVDAALLAVVLSCGTAIVVGARRFERRAHVSRASGSAARWRTWPADVGFGLVAAGVAGIVLEAAGLWTRLAVDRNPLAEQGAPLWVPWSMGAVLAVAMPAALDRIVPQREGRPVAVRAAACLVSAIVVLAVAAALHTGLDDGIQGRYYGVPGVAVGRSQVYEYGTCLGMVAPAVAGLLCVAALVVTARRHS